MRFFFGLACSMGLSAVAGAAVGGVGRSATAGAGACAAKGERDPIVLKMAALLAVVECTYYSHDISPERRAV